MILRKNDMFKVSTLYIDGLLEKDTILVFSDNFNQNWAKPVSIYTVRFNPCFIGSMYKNTIFLTLLSMLTIVSILVLLDLCIKTRLHRELSPCSFFVSILVLLDLCIKTYCVETRKTSRNVSILVLLDLCIKTPWICLLGGKMKNMFQSLFYWIYV